MAQATARVKGEIYSCSVVPPSQDPLTRTVDRWAMKNYSPCDKHDLIGCVTCTWKRPLGHQFVQLPDVPFVPDTNKRQPCGWCKQEFESWTGIVRYQGRYLHLLCMTDLGEPSFSTYDNGDTQHSHHDVDKWEPSIWPTVADRGWEREE